MPETTEIHFPAEWNGLVGIYGGYALAKLADIAQNGDAGRLASLNARFMSPVEQGTAAVTRAVLHSGRRTEVTRLTVEQSGRTRIEASAVSVPMGTTTISPQPPTPPHEAGGVECPDQWDSHPHVQGDLAFLRNLELRTPRTFEVSEGSSAWFRLAATPTSLGLDTAHAVACSLMDALLPVLFAATPRPVFVPTIEFTVHFSPLIDRVHDGWLLGRNRLEWASDDYCVESATLTTASGELLAQQRQIRWIQWRDEEQPR